MADSALNLDLARLVDEHHEVLYRYAFRLTGSAPDAEDLTQQAFLLAQQKLGQLRQTENSRGWLFAILRNCYLKGFRKRTPIAAASVDLDIDSIAAELIDQPSDAFDIDAEELQLALNELPADFKLVVLLFYFEERSYREMADMLDVPVGTIMSRLSRAKACLRRRLFEPAESLVPGRAEPLTPKKAEHVVSAAKGLTGNRPNAKSAAAIDHSADPLGQSTRPMGPPAAR